MAPTPNGRPGIEVDAPEPEAPVVLSELPARDKVTRLLKLAKGRRSALVLTHDNPDPDSIASAIALAYLLERRAGVETKVAYGGIIGRAENIAFVKVLHLVLSPISQIV
ncbi:MAG TPA: bifunctional oligoribonuclease/PAP phosphatase NrnA, partial [Myxococcaceae bacterium]|nr:bifunctional oligoribonuclease/PAP phosphatase NrnA [Myxococcaceae bacterium]